MRRSARAVLLILLGVSAAPLTVGGAAQQPVQYERDVQPILARACYTCHGPQTVQGGLRLDRRESALRGGKSGVAIVAGDSAASRLVRLVTEGEAGLRMPPVGEPLSPAEVALLRAWIDAGAVWPEGLDRAATHWSFQPVVRPESPRVRRRSWVRNPIDAFVLARLEAEALAPSRRASRETLLRRVSLDLTGLPPTPAEVDAFLADDADGAYERVVDRLLASPRYGEHWARWWLDAARYADTNGYESDRPRVMWKYRDWLIEALNTDMPFDQFTVEQLAGDMLPNASTAQQIATGFHRNSMVNEEGGVDKEQFRWEGVVDRVNTTGTVFLGLTVGCAQCHDHKYDPISQREYWQLFAFFNNADEPALELSPPDVLAKRDRLRDEIAELDKQAKALKDADPKREDLTKQIAELRRKLPEVLSTLVMQERSEPRPTRLHTRGDFLQPAQQVTAALPTALPPLPEDAPESRLGVARWLVDEANPLTARVTMNRIWAAYFGHGIVETLGDFGARGDAPTHPELLDWLASELARQQWSLKAMHRVIVTSATYQQDSTVSRKLLARDPDNRLLARGPRFRMDAEVIRDIALQASGLLSDKIGGPSVFSPQPEGVTALSYGALKWDEAAGEDRYRRGMYTFLKRTTPYAAFAVFDAPSRETCTVRRARSNTPLQALTTLNDAVFIEAAQAMAARVLRQGGATVDEQLVYAFRLAVTRKPDRYEMRRLAELLERQRALFAADAARGRLVALGDAKKPPPKDVAGADLAAWTIVSRVLLNLDETITKE